jgi:hypothetical protein
VNEWLTARARALGVDELAQEEISTLLNLAGDAAHESGSRTNAPLLCYLVGLAAGRGTGSLPELVEIVKSTS